MISDKLVGLTFRGLYEIDTRFFRIRGLDNLPRRLYILDSDPLNRIELLTFLSIVQEKSQDFTMDWNPDIADGFWPLKYLYVVWDRKDGYYILSRYFKKIKWKKILTV